MFDGRIMGERLPGETDETELGLLMAGHFGKGRLRWTGCPTGPTWS